MIWWVAAIVCCLDQLAKLWAVRTLGSGHVIPISENFLHLRYRTNTGGVAGLMQDHPQLLALLSVIALVIIIWWARSLPAEEKMARLGFGAVLGGAVGNLLDRLFRGGSVVDFIDAHWYNHEWLRWPTFNLADSAICIGIGLIVFAHLRAYGRTVQRESHAAVSSESDEAAEISQETID